MKTKRLFTLLLLLMVFASGCNKSDEPNNGGNNNDTDVRVTTYTPQDITATTAKCGGDVIVTQGLSLTELGVCWSVEQNPTVDKEHLSTTVWNESFVCTITNLEPDTKYYVRAYALRGLEYYYGDEKSFTTAANGVGGGIMNGHLYIDLGLPSGTLWATCNVGADKAEDFGDYYAWGETSPKTTYNWNTYQYCNGGSIDYFNSCNTLTKYCDNSHYGYNGFTDSLTTLQAIDDAATVNWGNGWRTPTSEEWIELYYNTTSTMTTQNGVWGRLFIASNNMSLFLPASGYRWIGMDFVDDACYWSSSLCTTDQEYLVSPDCAYFFGYFASDTRLGEGCRGIGFNVRPVRSSK